MTKKELSQLFCLGKEIHQQKERLQMLESMATNCNANYSGMPFSTGVGDKVGNYAVDIAELKELIELNLKRCFIEYNRVIRYIGTVEDSFVRQILTLRYVHGLPWQQVAQQMGGNTADSVRMAHDRFLSKK